MPRRFAPRNDHFIKAFTIITWKDLQEILKSACNLPLKKKELKAIASEIIHLARVFNQREGVTKKDDKLPRRFFREVLGETRKTIQPEELEYMLKEYYQMRGWLNPAT